MPYITEERRKELLESIFASHPRLPEPLDEGELNFIITHFVQSYIMREWHSLCYASLNEVVGVLECVKQELYRRVAAPYEDNKCQQNGEVYWI